MSEHRILSQKNKYYLPKETFLMIIHYCKQYPEWIAELQTSEDPRKAVAYDQDRVQSSGGSDPTAALAIRRAEISAKTELIERTAKDVAGVLWKWVILGVCYDNPYYYLKQQGIPCGKDLYYNLRRRFFYEMAKKV